MRLFGAIQTVADARNQSRELVLGGKGHGSGLRQSWGHSGLQAKGLKRPN